MRIVTDHKMIIGCIAIELVVYHDGNAMRPFTVFIDLLIDGLNFRELEYFVHCCIQSNSVFAGLERIMYVNKGSVRFNSRLCNCVLVRKSNNDFPLPLLQLNKIARKKKYFIVGDYA